MNSKIHVTVISGIIAVTAIVCATILALNGKDYAVLAAIATGSVGVIGGLAVPSFSGDAVAITEYVEPDEAEELPVNFFN